VKILYIVTQADGGGAQQYVLTLARQFKGEIAAGTEDTKLFDAAEELGILTHPLPHLKRNISPLNDFLAIIDIILLVQKLQPDIVHLNSSKAGFLGSLIAPFVKAKIVFTAHGFRFNEPFSQPTKQFYFVLEKFASFFRDYIITVSDFDRRSALANRMISPKKISTIHNGIPSTVFLAKDEARSQLKLPQHIFIFGTIANFYKTKGLDVYVEAVSKLPKKILEKCVFVIIGGGGPEEADLRFKIKDLRLENTILLAGKIPNAKTYLKAFDVFVQPSRKEGFSYSLLEAMQAGLPIITTSVGGSPEAVGDAGILVPPENSEKLSLQLHELFINEQKRKGLSEKALERNSQFTEQKMLEETEKIYLHVLEK
jgi:glycosyltransferase involved in cell wall biosynthesis